MKTALAIAGFCLLATVSSRAAQRTARGTATLCVDSFYDANANGIPDPGETLIDGWKVVIAGALARGTPVWVTVEAEQADRQISNYEVWGISPLERHWISTTPQTVGGIVLAADTTATILFGNVCLGVGGGQTPGFWSNKNGQAIINDGGTTAPELGLLGFYNLRDASGGNFNPATDASLRSWLLDVNPANMAYMLSVQTAAMVLNVESGSVSGSALVHAPQLLRFPAPAGLNSQGFITIGNLLAAANSQLAAHGYVPDGDPARPYQEALKIALDHSNNNRTFVQAAPCPFSFAP